MGRRNRKRTYRWRGFKLWRPVLPSWLVALFIPPLRPLRTFLGQRENCSFNQTLLNACSHNLPHTFPLRRVETLPKRLCSIPVGSTTSSRTKRGKMLGLVDNLYEAPFKSLEGSQGCRKGGEGERVTLTTVNIFDISLAGSFSNLFILTIREYLSSKLDSTHKSIMVFPNPYHRPPAPTRLDNRTLRASATSALRTRAPNGVGMFTSAQPLDFG
jgi:hypothetical protein